MCLQIASTPSTHPQRQEYFHCNTIKLPHPIPFDCALQDKSGARCCVSLAFLLSCRSKQHALYLSYCVPSGRRGTHTGVYTGANYATHQQKAGKKLVVAYMPTATWETREDFLVFPQRHSALAIWLARLDRARYVERMRECM